MAEVNIVVSQWRYVEVGRIVLFTHGEFAGRLATTVEIVDHKRVRLLSVFLSNLPLSVTLSFLAIVTYYPSPDPRRRTVFKTRTRRTSTLCRPRQCHSHPNSHRKVAKGGGRGAVKKAWEKQEIEKKWDESAWAKKREQREKRKNLSDFERFQVLKLKKQVGCALYMLVLDGYFE